VRHGGEKTLDELEVWGVEGDRALEVDEVVDLLSGRGGDGGVAAEVSGITSSEQRACRGGDRGKAGSGDRGAVGRVCGIDTGGTLSQGGAQPVGATVSTAARTYRSTPPVHTRM